MSLLGCADLHALDLQLHVVLSRRFPILPFLPAVTVLPVLHLLSVVQDDAAVLRPGRQKHISVTAVSHIVTPSASSARLVLKLWCESVCVPGFQSAGEPLVMSVKRYQVRSDLLQNEQTRKKNNHHETKLGLTKSSHVTTDRSEW